MTITLITTVLNEGESIRRLMDSLCAQTRQPDEIVVVDGGSTDSTVKILFEYQARLPLRIEAEAGCNISRGRNLAIRAARGDIIAVTDAGVVLANDWLQHITQPLLDHPDLHVVSGFFQADAQTPFEVAMGATVLPLKEEVKPQTFLPSSRSVAFRKSAWEQVGGYPEWLDYCEDLIFDLRLKMIASPFAFAPQAIAHFRPRGSLRAFWKQYYQYARGDGKADLWRKRHAIRYLTYLAALPALLILGVIQPLFWGLLLAGAAVYLYQPFNRLPVVMRQRAGSGLESAVSFRDYLYILAMMPIIRVVGDVAKMAGYPVGWRWRLRHKPPDWKSL
jgi:glycosyltransferase involved in cell wall biosynthesis